MNQSTTNQTSRRYRPIKFPGTSTPSTQMNVSHGSSQVSRPGIVWTESTGKSSTEKGTILRHDASSEPRPCLIAERRLDKYVEYYRAARTGDENLVAEQQRRRATANLVQNVQEKSPVEVVGIGKTHLSVSEQDHFVARTDFDRQFAANQWGVPVARGAISLGKAALTESTESTEPNSVKRADRPHSLEGRAHLNFPEETINDQAGFVPDGRQFASTSNAGFNPADREQKILADPNTSDIVAAVSSAIASVIGDQTEEQLLPEAKSLFESNLKQHSVVLDDTGRQRENQTTENSISDAMISSIAEQRQLQDDMAPISSTVSPTTLADQLRERIAKHQRSMVESNSASRAGATDAITAATNRAETPVAEVADESSDVSNDQRRPLVKFKQSHETSIPMEAAAWDVEDFRWPAITNQMIVTGGPAIEQLLSIATSQVTAQPKRIVVTSAGRAQGATTIAITMARMAVAAGMRTLLVDADVASPSLSQRIGLAANMSWLNGINKDLPMSELIVRSKASNMCTMPLSSTVTRVTWPRFIFDNLGQLLEPSQSYFDLVLIDAGPASQLLDELSRPANLLDAVILVDSTAKMKEIEVYQNRLSTFGIDNLVLAENRKTAAASNVA